MSGHATLRPRAARRLADTPAPRRLPVVYSGLGCMYTTTIGHVHTSPANVWWAARATCEAATPGHTAHDPQRRRGTAPTQLMAPSPRSSSYPVCGRRPISCGHGLGDGPRQAAPRTTSAAWACRPQPATPTPPCRSSGARAHNARSNTGVTPMPAWPRPTSPGVVPARNTLKTNLTTSSLSLGARTEGTGSGTTV